MARLSHLSSRFLVWRILWCFWGTWENFLWKVACPLKIFLHSWTFWMWKYIKHIFASTQYPLARGQLICKQMLKTFLYPDLLHPCGENSIVDMLDLQRLVTKLAMSRKCHLFYHSWLSTFCWRGRPGRKENKHLFHTHIFIFMWRDPHGYGLI